MIHNISEIKKRSTGFIKKFLDECIVEEKIDAPYVQVEIRRQILVYRKCGRKLTGVDLILNDDYTLLMKEWEMLRHVNSEWFDAHVGYTINMFFLPCATPVVTEYRPDVRYIIDTVARWGMEENIADEMRDLKMLDEFHVWFKRPLERLSDIDDLTLETTARTYRTSSSDVSGTELVSHLFDTSQVFAAGEPEGFIIKNHKFVYQTSTHERVLDHKERTQYEYLLIDFSSFWESIDDIYALIGNSDYVNSVCTLFNAYVEWQQRKPLKENIDAAGIEPPYLGHKPETGFRHIPNMKTVQLCKRSKLMENAFKVLLVNLQKEKKLQQCVLMNQHHVDRWNSIVKTLKIAVNN